jgi:hypothetical protein
VTTDLTEVFVVSALERPIDGRQMDGRQVDGRV